MNKSIFLLVVILGCSKPTQKPVVAPSVSTPAVSSELAPVPQAAGPTHVKFNMSGLTIGDPLTTEFARSRTLLMEKNTSDVRYAENVKLDGGEMRVLYTFRDGKFAYGGAFFDPEQYEEIVQYYADKFGCLPHNTHKEGINEASIWLTDCGEFVVRKYYGDKLTDGSAIIYTDPDERKRTSL